MNNPHSHLTIGKQFESLKRENDELIALLRKAADYLDPNGKNERNIKLVYEIDEALSKASKS